MADRTALSLLLNRIAGSFNQNLLFGLILLTLLSACSSGQTQPAETPSSSLEITPISLESIAETATVMATLAPAKTATNEAPNPTTSDQSEGNDPLQANETSESNTGEEGGEKNQESDETEQTSPSEDGPNNQENEPSEDDPSADDPETAGPTITVTVETDLPGSATKTATPGATSPAIDSSRINSIPIEEIVDISPAVREHIKEIYASGLTKGRNPSAFSKLGDSLIANPHFLTGFDTQPYDLGLYSFLQAAIDQYAGSFERYGVAIKAGLHSWGVFDPIWADKDWCQPNENLLACEFRLNNPSVLLILLGSNDSGAPDSFDYNLRKVVEFSIDNGVIPVLATKADRFEGQDNRNNLILRQIAADSLIPLWDFDLIAETLPGKGLQDDQVHLTIFVENDYTMPEAFQTGHGVHNLTALMVLDRIREIVMEETD